MPPVRARNTTTAGRLNTAALVCALACLGLGPSVAVGASATISPAADHDCACGTACTGKCCCVPRGKPARSRPPAPAPTPTSIPAETPEGRDSPCLAAAPCGLPDSPAPAPSTPTGKPAAMAPAILPPWPMIGPRPDTEPDGLLPAAAPEPPDDPPEDHSTP